MALIPMHFTRDTRDLNLRKARFLTHSFSFPFNADVNNLRTQGLCTPGDPPGYTFVSSLEIEENGLYPFNLLVPDIYTVIVLYTTATAATLELEVGDLLIVGNIFYEVLNAISPGQIILLADLLDVTDQVIFENRDLTTMYVPQLGVYDIVQEEFCAFPGGEERGNLLPVRYEFRYEGQRVYDKLPIDTYNLGEREDRDLVIVQNLTELNQIVTYLPVGRVVYVHSTAEYFQVATAQGDIFPKTDNLNLISPTRWLLSGVDAGLDFVEDKTNTLFTELADPETAIVENLPWTAQLYGMSGLADGNLYSPRFFGVDFAPDSMDNPLSELEIRTLLRNGLGWGRPYGEQFTNVVPLFNQVFTTFIDFVFDGTNNFNIVQIGDQGIRLNNDTVTEYIAIAPTDETNITLRDNADEAASPVTVLASDRVHGVIYNRLSNSSTKGVAMESFVENIPTVYVFEPYARRHTTTINDKPIEAFKLEGMINYQNWVSNPQELELVPGSYYVVLTETEDEPLPEIMPADYNPDFATDPNAIIGEILPLRDDGGTEFYSYWFQVNPILPTNKVYVWEDLNNVSFTAVEPTEKSITPAVDFNPDNWLGVVGSRGSLYGVTVANSVLGLTNPAPNVAHDGIAVTRVETSQEFAKAKKLEEYIGEDDRVTKVQYSDLQAGLSFSNDYWFEDKEYPDFEQYEYLDFQYTFQRSTKNLLKVNVGTGELTINNGTTNRFFLPGSLLMTGMDSNLYVYYHDPISLPLRTIYRLEFRQALGGFELFDTEVEAVNTSHAFYYKFTETAATTGIIEIYREGRQIDVQELTWQTVPEIYLLKEYPYLIIRKEYTAVPDSVILIWDLLTNKRFYISDTRDLDLMQTVPTGEILYIPRTIYLVTNLVELTTGDPEQLLYPYAREITSPNGINIGKISPHYLNVPYYDFLDSQFDFYEVINVENDRLYLLDRNLIANPEAFVDVSTSYYGAEGIAKVPEDTTIDELRFYF